ncbi:MAG: RICIN domain-containing protein [Ktedonobacteraceae bacterium]|nr:RICIN domain-containing protein [Ktedonobacteraceae bacterium]
MQRRNAFLSAGSKRIHPSGRVLLISGILLMLLFITFSTVRGTIFAENLPVQAAAPANTAVTTYHNDTLRTGQNSHETILTSSNVNSSQFGKRVTYPVDGQVYAQPLYLPNVSIHGTVHNVVYVATENDSVYAFDADQTTAIAPLWKTSFTGPNVTAVPAGDVFTRYANHDIDPQIGITSTPVIDPATNILYVVAMTKENGQYFQRIHAIDVTTGAEKAGSPLAIQASVSGTGADSSGGQVHFNAKTEDQRPALLLLNGNVYISWASFGDTDPYHGWIIGYHYTGSALQQVSSAAYNDTPNGSEGGIWMSGGGPAADSSGNMYLITGNGTYDLNSGGPDAGDSFLKMSTQSGLSVSDYFTPFNQSCLAANDADLGSGGPLLLPDQTNTAHPHLVISAGKEGRIYVVDRDHMGRFTNDPNLNCNSSEVNQTTSDQVLQELPPGTIGPDFANASYWASSSQAWIYVGGVGDTLKAFQLSNDTLSSRPTSRTSETFQFPGITPSISSNGNTNGIVWAVSPPPACGGNGCNPSGPGVLHAYDATNLGNELYTSGQNVSRDQLDSYTKFSVPTIANGEVFVGTLTSLSIYGLLTSSGSFNPNAHYKLVNVNSGKDLDVTGASTADGALVVQWTDHAGTNQQWNIIAVGSSYKLVNVNSGKDLDVTGASTADGALVVQWTDHGGTNQQWNIVQVS